MWGNQMSVIQFTAFDPNFINLIAFNTLIKKMKLRKQSHIWGLVIIIDS